MTKLTLLLVSLLAVKCQADCSWSFYSATCDYWVSTSWYTCSALENTYGWTCNDCLLCGEFGHQCHTLGYWGNCNFQNGYYGLSCEWLTSYGFDCTDCEQCCDEVTSSNHYGCLSAKGDPHLVNVKGEAFDVMQTGNMLMLEVPLGSSDANLDLAIRADIDSLEVVECGPTFITSVYMTGRWLGAPLDISSGPIKKNRRKMFGIRLNHEEWQAHSDFVGRELSEHATIKTQDREFIMKVGALDIVVSQPKRPRVFLDLNIKGISKLTSQVGGLLGVGDHSAAEELPAVCNEQLLAANANAHERLAWSAKASL